MKHPTVLTVWFVVTRHEVAVAEFLKPAEARAYLRDWNRYAKGKYVARLAQRTFRQVTNR